MGIGDWGLGIGDWAPIPNPQSPLLYLFFFLMAIVEDDTANNLYPVLGRKNLAPFKKFMIGLAFLLSFFLCVDSLTSWLFMNNLTCEEKQKEKLSAAAPCQLLVEENSKDVALDVEMNHMVWRS
jgi:hypothetical protein